MFGQDYPVNVDVTDPSEYRDAIDAAETLGLDLQRVDAYGYGWEAADDAPVNPGAGGREVEIEKVGQKYFHMKLSGPDGTDVVPVECGKPGHDTDLRPARLTLRFG